MVERHQKVDNKRKLVKLINLLRLNSKITLTLSLAGKLGSYGGLKVIT